MSSALPAWQLLVFFGAGESALAFDGLSHFQNTPLGTCYVNVQAAYTESSQQGRAYVQVTPGGYFPEGTLMGGTLSNVWTGMRSSHSSAPPI